MIADEERSHRVQEYCGVPVYVENRKLPDLPQRASEINNEDVLEGKQLFAGAARIDVTPSGSILLQGYGGREPRNSTGIHDRLYVRALTLDNGQEKMALISWDKIRINGGFDVVAKIRREINKRTGIPASNILVGVTHTHSSDGDVTAEPAVEAAVKAWENRKSARIGVGAKMIYGIGANRRLPDGTGLWDNKQSNPHRPVDNECGVIRVEDMNRNVLAAVVQYTCHPSVLGPDSTVVSGDFAGFGMLEMEKRLGGNAVVFYLQGCAGDIGTQTFRTSRTTAEVERLGRTLANEAMDILQRTDVIRWLPIRCKNRFISLPRKPADASIPTSPPNPPSDDGGQSVKDELQALVIGDTLLLCLGSMEAYIEHCLAIKDISPFARAFVLAYANGPTLGYLPSPHGYAVQDEDAKTTPFSVEAGKVLHEEALRLISEIK